MRNGFCYFADKLPTDILGVKIDTRASTAIAIMLKFDEEVSGAEQALYASLKLFKKAYPEVVELAHTTPEKLDMAIVEYLSGPPQAKSWADFHADPSKTSEDSVSDKNHKITHPTKDFDFVQDSALITASFRQVYGLSLDDTCNLHWWEFLALFSSIPSEGNTFGTVRSIRNRKPRKDDSPEAKADLAKAKRAVKLIDTRSPERKAREIQDQFNALEL